MKIEEFKELEKENKYISNLLKTQQEDIQEKLEVFFETLHDEIRQHNFIVCVHPHYFPVQISVFNGTDKDSDKLTIQNFKIINKTDDFHLLVMDLIKNWLRRVTS